MEHRYFSKELHQLQFVEEQLQTNKLLKIYRDIPILLSPGPVYPIRRFSSIKCR
jgi:hypothetical protein